MPEFNNSQSKAISKGKDRMYRHLGVHKIVSLVTYK